MRDLSRQPGSGGSEGRIGLRGFRVWGFRAQSCDDGVVVLVVAVAVVGDDDGNVLNLPKDMPSSWSTCLRVCCCCAVLVVW